MSTLVERARAFALGAHQRFHRVGGKNGRHEERLEAVAATCALKTDDEVTLALAWVYDSVENTAATFDELERELGRELADLVFELTPLSRPGDGTPDERHALDRRHLGRASARAKTVKLAELIAECRAGSRPGARVTGDFVAERTALLELLAGGEPALFDKAKSLLERCALRAERPPANGAAPSRERESPRPEEVALQAAFLRAFAARDLAEPLAPDERERASAKRDDQWVLPSAGLSDVVMVLTRHDECFVRAAEQPASVITRGDMQKPAARMWLFGIITLAEMEFARRIRALWPDGAWSERLSPGRLEKTRALHAERKRRGQHLDLVECLQLSDKAQLLMTDPGELTAFGFETTSAAKRAVRELESLRNNLAHAQDIVAYDWPQIIRLAWRVLPATPRSA
jgi:hypothetical protein